MHQSIPPGLTAITGAIRAMLAAGWRLDHVDDGVHGSRVRDLIHPSGREITAVTGAADDDGVPGLTALTMTGLDLEQVAGAIRGAGLTGEPSTDHPHAKLIASLRELAALLESRPDLAAGKYSSGVSVGALRSREQLEAWATALGAEIAMGGTDKDIPVIYHQMPGFQFSAQAPAEPARSRLVELEEENARLRAELEAQQGQTGGAS